MAGCLTHLTSLQVVSSKPPTDTGLLHRSHCRLNRVRNTFASSDTDLTMIGFGLRPRFGVLCLILFASQRGEVHIVNIDTKISIYYGTFGTVMRIRMGWGLGECQLAGWLTHLTSLQVVSSKPPTGYRLIRQVTLQSDSGTYHFYLIGH